MESTPQSSCQFSEDWEDNSEVDQSETWSYFSEDGTSSVTGSKLSAAIRGGYTGHKIKFCIPKECVSRKPLFSGRLGTEPRIQRAASVESIETQLSLLTCSMINSEPVEEKQDRKRRRRRRKKVTETTTPVPTESKWIQFANQKKGILDRLMVTQNALATANYNMDQAHIYQVRGTGSAYDLMDEDEREMLYKCAFRTGIKMSKNGLVKSGSTTNLAGHTILMDNKRQTLSAGGKRSKAKEQIDFSSWKEHLAKERSESMNCLENQTKERNVASIELPTIKPARKTMVRIWQEDSIEGDVKHEFSSKVKERVKSTTRALKRLTGVGECNRRGLKTAGTHPEFPRYTAADFSRIPKMQQRIRISPQLSSMIGEDIKERMGRPKYHEISSRDLKLWDKGSKLDRTHRNLKVFNWLNSLKEEEFEMDIEQDIDDRPPSPNYIFPAGSLHIEACDDPDEKPMYARASLKFIERVQGTAVSA